MYWGIERPAALAAASKACSVSVPLKETTRRPRAWVGSQTKRYSGISVAFSHRRLRDVLAMGAPAPPGGTLVVVGAAGATWASLARRLRPLLGIAYVWRLRERQNDEVSDLEAAVYVMFVSKSADARRSQTENGGGEL